MENNNPIYAKLVELRKSLPYFKKSEQGHNYKYVAGVDILVAIQNKMNELGLLLYPEIDEREITMVEEVKQKKVGNDWKDVEAHSWLVNCTGFYVWHDVESGKKLPVKWIFTAEQIDPSRAFGSALTYSERYFLLKFFNIPTDELDPDEFKEQKPFLFNDIMAPSKQKRELTKDELDWFNNAIRVVLPSDKAEATKEWIKQKHTPEAIAQTKLSINIIADELDNR